MVKSGQLQGGHSSSLKAESPTAFVAPPLSSSTTEKPEDSRTPSASNQEQYEDVDWRTSFLGIVDKSAAAEALVQRALRSASVSDDNLQRRARALLAKLGTIRDEFERALTVDNLLELLASAIHLVTRVATWHEEVCDLVAVLNDLEIDNQLEETKEEEKRAVLDMADADFDKARVDFAAGVHAAMRSKTLLGGNLDSEGGRLTELVLLIRHDQRRYAGRLLPEERQALDLAVDAITTVWPASNVPLPDWFIARHAIAKVYSCHYSRWRGNKVELLTTPVMMMLVTATVTKRVRRPLCGLGWSTPTCFAS